MQGLKKYMILLTGVFLTLAFACSIDRSLGKEIVATNRVEVIVTNGFTGSTNKYYVTNYYSLISVRMVTNLAIVTNTVNIYKSNYCIQGNIYITNEVNQGRIQPTFRLIGYIDGDLPSYIADGMNSVEVIVTNTKTTNKAKVTTIAGGRKKWEAVVFTQKLPYIYVKVRANLTGIGNYYMAMNYYVSNIPAWNYSKVWGGITNNDTVTVTGNAWLNTNAGDYIKEVYFKIEKEGQPTEYPSSTSLSRSKGWTNSVTNGVWEKAISLAFGNNDITPFAVSAKGITNYMTKFSYIRALIGVDGVKDAMWNTAPSVGESTIAGYGGYRIGKLRITNDAQMLYFWVDSVNVPATIASKSAAKPRVTIVIDTNNASGAAGDAWCNAANEPYMFRFQPTNNCLPDFQIQMRILTETTYEGAAMYRALVGAWTEWVYTWNGGNLKGCKFGVVRVQGYEYGIPLALLGLSSGSKINTMAILGGSDPDGALDVIPESPLNMVATNSPATNIQRVYCKPYTVK